MKSILLPHLETFVKAAELSSFTAAGRSLGVSQAAVSQNIQSLEQSLGASLFHRQGGHILLTQGGQRLYEYAQRILALHQEARREITGIKEELVGELFLAASSVPGEHLLPSILAKFRELYPHIRIRVTVSDSAAVQSLVEHGKANLGLLGKKSASSLLEFRPFARDQLVLVVAAHHPWAKRRQITVKQLCEQPLILREVGSGARDHLEQSLATVGVTLDQLQIALELGSNEAIKDMVARNLGAAVLSDHAVAREVEAGQLHALHVADLELHRDMYVAWDKRRVLSPASQLFLTFLTTQSPA